MDNEKLSEMNILEKVRWGSSNLPVRQRLVCDYLHENYQQVVFMTVEDLAKQSGLSPSTVVRAVAGLGFESYHALQEELQNLMISSKTSLWWQLENSWGKEKKDPSNNDKGIYYPKDSDNAENSLVVAIRDNIEALTQSLTPLILENFDKSVALLEQADRIFFLGMRSSQGITRYGFSLFHQFMSNVYMIDNSGSEEMFDYLIDMTPRDCLLALSYGGPHYASRTFDVIDVAHSMEVPIILMTSELSSPAAPFSDIILSVSPARNHYTMAPALTTLEALTIELGKRLKTPAMKKLRKLEKILQEKKIIL